MSLAPKTNCCLAMMGLWLAAGSAAKGLAGEAPAAQRGVPRLGINLGGTADWSTELAFVDVFRTSRPWTSQKRGEAYGRGPALELDRWGWIKRLEPGCFATTLLCTITGGHYPAGVYTVFYEGEGEIAFRGPVKVVDQRPGQMRIDVDSSQGGFALQLMRTNPENPVRNIHVIMPGFEDRWQADPFHPAFLSRWQGMACFRFMGWMNTNGSELAHWDDRPTLRHATFMKRGVALEWMIDLCNRVSIDPWFCLPHLADDQFVRNFAQMVKDRLDPSRKVYVEYSNEVWNGQFPQSQYAARQGVALGLAPANRLGEATAYFTAHRSTEIFRIWEDVFGGHQRLIRLLPSQSGNTWVSEQVLGFRGAAAKADALATAPYMPFSVGRGKLADFAGRMDGWDVDQLLDHFEHTAFADSLVRMDKDKAVADKYGLRLMAYEGGQHMVAFVKDRALLSRLTALMQEANRHRRMGDMYDRYYAHWRAIGGDTFATFASIGSWRDSGAWGLAEYYDSRPADYPKLEATLRTAADWGQAVNY